MIQALHIASPWFQTHPRKSPSMSNGIARVAVRRSDDAKEKMKTFVGILRRFLLISIAEQTMMLPMTATATIKI